MSGEFPSDEPLNDQEPLRWPNGNGIDGIIESALDRLDDRRARVRDPQTGRWTLANGGRVVTGETSEAFWADLAPATAALEAQVRTQLALTDPDAPPTAVHAVGAFAEAVVWRRAEFLQVTRLNNRTAVSAKEKRRQRDQRRQHQAAWAAANDRQLKWTQLLGLTRRARPVKSIEELLAESEER